MRRKRGPIGCSYLTRTWTASWIPKYKYIYIFSEHHITAFSRPVQQRDKKCQLRFAAQSYGVLSDKLNSSRLFTHVESWEIDSYHGT
jgi:hypothetical protein